MSLLFMDSFDHYATADLSRKWNIDTSGEIGSYGRYGTKGWRQTSFNDSLRRSIGSQVAAATVGAAVRVDAGYDVWLLSLASGSTTQVGVRFEGATGELKVYRQGSVLLGTCSGVYLTETWMYVELQVGSFHGSTGSCKVRVNGVEVANLTNVNTDSAGTAYADVLALSYPILAGYQRCQWDDIYLTDATDFLGDCRVECLLPSGNGASSGWTGSDADQTDNYLLVDEVAPDGDTTYVEADGVGDKDTYAMGNLATAAGTVLGVQTVLVMRKNDTGSRQVAPVLRHSGTDYDGTSISAGDSYVFGTEIEEQNPGTAAAWSIADVNAVELGAKVTA